MVDLKSKVQARSTNARPNDGKPWRSVAARAVGARGYDLARFRRFDIQRFGFSPFGINEQDGVTTLHKAPALNINESREMQEVFERLKIVDELVPDVNPLEDAAKGVVQVSHRSKRDAMTRTAPFTEGDCG